MQPGRSATKLWIICSAALAVGFIALAYLNFVQYQNAQDAARLAKGTITDLRYQLGLDEKAASPSPSPSISPSPSTSPTPTPTTSASPTPTTTPTAAPAGRSATTNQPANLHTQPNIKSAVITRLATGTVVALGSTVSGGYQEVSANGQTGYVLQSYLKY